MSDCYLQKRRIGPACPCTAEEAQALDLAIAALLHLVKGREDSYAWPQVIVDLDLGGSVLIRATIEVLRGMRGTTDA